jgi:hypothetical protein
MLRIRQEQMDVIYEHAVHASRARIVKRLQATIPEDTANYEFESLLSLCDSAISKADSYGMGSEQGTYVYCATMLLFGENFDVNPLTAWSRDVLPIETIDGDLKWRLLALRIKMDTGRYVY